MENVHTSFEGFPKKFCVIYGEEFFPIICFFVEEFFLESRLDFAERICSRRTGYWRPFFQVHRVEPCPGGRRLLAQSA